MIEKVKVIFEEINWTKILHYLFLFTLFFYLNFSLINFYLLKGQGDNLSDQFHILKTFCITAYILSVLGIAVYLSSYFKREFFIEIASGYVIYLFISYFLVITRNLNNGDFKWWNLIKNDFLQFSFLPTIIFILLLSAAIFYLSSKFQVRELLDSFLAEFDSYRLVTIGLIASLILNGSLFTDMMVEKVTKYIDKGNYSGYLSSVTWSVMISLVLISLLIYFVLNSFRAIKENTPSYSLVVVLSFLLAIVFNYLFQYGIKSEGEILDRFIFPSATLFQIVVIALFNLLLYMIVNRILRTTTFIVILGIIITVANSVKFSMRNEPLLFSDLSWVKEIRLVISYIEIRLVLYSLVALSVIVIFFYLFRNQLLRGKITKNWKARLATGVTIISIFSYTFVVFLQQENGDIAENIPILSRLNNFENIEWMGQGTVARERSLTFVWLKQMTSKKMEKPEEYSKEKIEKIVKKYTHKAQVINASRKNNISDQTVIYVLSESFSDPSRISNVNLTTDPIPVIRSVKESTTSGLMKSDGYGGGTANLEFETLTGLPMYNLSSSVSTLYTDVVPQMTYFPSISDSYSSKDKYTIHLGDAATYSRKEVYRKLGFDTFIAESNGTERAKHLEHYGVYPSDASTYQTVLDNIDESKNQFFSVITYQNHAPWNLDEDSEVGGSGEGFSSGENYYINNYAKLLYQTDKATQNWLDQLSQINKKITVVFYGDHLPGFYPQESFIDNPAGQYQTDYFIWSNYSTDVLSYPLVNSSDFPAELLAVTNSKVSPYYALLTEVLENASVDKEKLTTEQEKIANDLKLVEYDMVSGKGYLKSYKSFFKVIN